MSFASLRVYSQNISTAREKIAQIYLQYLQVFPSLIARKGSDRNCQLKQLPLARTVSNRAIILSICFWAKHLANIFWKTPGLRGPLWIPSMTVHLRQKARSTFSRIVSDAPDQTRPSFRQSFQFPLTDLSRTCALVDLCSSLLGTMNSGASSAAETRLAGTLTAPITRVWRDPGTRPDLIFFSITRPVPSRKSKMTG